MRTRLFPGIQLDWYESIVVRHTRQDGSSVLQSFLAAGCDLLSCVLRGGFGGAKVYSCGLPNLSVGVGWDLLSEDDPIGGPFYLYCGWQ